jgi:GGDEF domain-containing protein
LTTGDFERATGALERAVDVDAYEGGHQARLESLRGKVDAGRLGGLDHRLAGIRTTTAIEQENPPAANHLAVLEDLMVEAEIFCHYSLLAQAGDAVAKIREKFPFEEHNPRLRELCITLGLQPRGAPVVRLRAPAGSPPQAGGLLKRSSYLDVLLAEVARSKAQGSPLTLLLLEFSAPDSAPEGDPCTWQELMQNAGETVCSHLRHSDLAVRYGPAQIAVLLANTPEKDASLVIDDLRQALKKTCGDSTCVSLLTVGVSEANLDPRFDAADIATEVINRVEDALEQAKSAAAGAAYALAYSAPAVRLAEFVPR